MPKPTLSVSLVLYHPDLPVLAKTLECLAKSVLNAELSNTQLYVIDNSCDPAVQEAIAACLNQHFPATSHISSHLIVNPANTGYGHANNVAIEQIASDYHLVINPDVFVFPDTLATAIAYLQAHPDVGLLSPAVFGEDGAQHYLCKRDPTLFDMFSRGLFPKFIQPWFRKRMEAYEMRERDYQAIMDDLEFPSGCCLFLRTDKLKQLKGFDPRFFMYYEDADLGRRMRALARVVYVPEIKIIHQWARGTHHQWRLKLITIKSGLAYWWKWGGYY